MRETPWPIRALRVVALLAGVAVLALSVLLIAEPKRVLLGAKAKLVEGLRELALRPQFRRPVLGYTAYTAPLAGFSIWVAGGFDPVATATR